MSQILLDAVHNYKIWRNLVESNNRLRSYKKMRPYHNCNREFSSGCKECRYRFYNREITRLQNIINNGY